VEYSPGLEEIYVVLPLISRSQGYKDIVPGFAQSARKIDQVAFAPAEIQRR